MLDAPTTIFAAIAGLNTDRRAIGGRLIQP
jgi:hypothetical protein